MAIITDMGYKAALCGAIAITACAWANTGTVTAELSGDGTAFTVTFADHANETNSLWVVYGDSDCGLGTNGWTYAERLGLVSPETNSWTYAAPSGWGDTVKVLRFLLSEVPYDYDYTLDFIRSNKKQRICLNDFDMYCSYRICAKFSYSGNSGTQAIFTTRDGGKGTPYFHLFLVNNLASWRFDYNANTGSNKGSPTQNTVYSIEAGWNGLYVNGDLVNSKASAATYTDGKTANGLQFLNGGTSSTEFGNTGASSVTLYGAQIYDEPTGGDMIVNLVPMVKDGRAGMYDTVRNVYYYSDTGHDFELSDGPSRIESSNPFFASALYRVAATGPDVFTTASSTTFSESCTNSFGAILDGTATLTLTGYNDWGGSFIVSNGTLVAAFGQGLAATDCLRLASSDSTTYARNGTYGGYGGWNGRATASLGSGAGQIYVTEGNFLSYCAADGGELEVDIGGEGASFVPTADTRRLLLNGAAGAGTLRFTNPIALNDQHLITRIGFGTTIFTKGITNVNSAADAKTMTGYNLENADVDSDGTAILQGSNNVFNNFNLYSGTWIMDENTTNKCYGGISLYMPDYPLPAALLLATNAVVSLTGENGQGGWLYVYGGNATFVGGELTAGGFIVGLSGQNQSNSARAPRLTFSGKVTLQGISGNPQSYGSGTICTPAASEALTITDGADVSMYNLTFLRRNIHHRGGSLCLKGSYGLLRMGEEGTARYQLYSGATLTTIGASQGPSSSEFDGIAQFLFRGGTVVTRAASAVFFRDFGPQSSIWIASNYGGEFRATHDTSITNGMETAPSGICSGSGSWDYSAEDWLTAPSFKKSGDATLTLAGTNTYICATDIAAGTLKLASGDTPGVLPTNGVVILSGGTLDLNGNTQTVHALVGTAGSAVDGTVAATDGIYPGGAGAVGSFTSGATLAGTLNIDFDASTGTADKIVASGTLDISNLALALPTSDDFPGTVKKITVIEGTTSGAFTSVSGLPTGWEVYVSANKVQVRKNDGFTVIVR